MKKKTISKASDFKGDKDIFKGKVAQCGELVLEAPCGFCDETTFPMIMVNDKIICPKCLTQRRYRSPSPGTD